MKYPEMIIFDYGGTLLYEPGFDPMAIERVTFEHLTANPSGLTAEQIYEHTHQLFEKLAEHRKNGIEIHQHHFMALAYESLGLEFDISYSELEELQWNAASPGAVMPHTEEFLDYLNEEGIRTAVISNIGWSQEALTRRLNRLLPRNRFEFVIASSSYGVRKPDRLLFDIALHKAGLPADKVWYCGDTPVADVIGAHNAGIFPVHYLCEPPGETYRPAEWYNRPALCFQRFSVRDWLQLQGYIRQIKDIINACPNG